MKWLLALLLILGVAAAFFKLSSGADRWRRQETSAAAGASDGLLFTLDADAAAQGWLTTSRPQLTVRCFTPNGLDLTVITGLNTAVESGNTRSVRLQFDDEEAAVGEWTQAPNHQALSAPPLQTRALVEHLAKSKRFSFAFVPFRSEPTVVNFATNGFAAHWQEAQSRCAIR